MKKLFSEEDPKLAVPSNVRVKIFAQKPLVNTPKQNKKTVNFLQVKNVAGNVQASRAREEIKFISRRTKSIGRIAVP